MQTQQPGAAWKDHRTALLPGPVSPFTAVGRPGGMDPERETPPWARGELAGQRPLCKAELPAGTGAVAEGAPVPTPSACVSGAREWGPWRGAEDREGPQLLRRGRSSTRNRDDLGRRPAQESS